LSFHPIAFVAALKNGTKPWQVAVAHTTKSTVLPDGGRLGSAGTVNVVGRFSRAATAAFFRGWALVDEGRGQEGLAEMSRALPALEGNSTTTALYAFLTDSYRKNGRPEEGLATVAAALKIAREEGLRTILDPAPAQALHAGMLRDVDILTPNEAEACMLLGRDPARIAVEDAAAVAADVAALGAHMVIVKMGDRGCFFFGAGEAYHVPGFEVQSVDSTGAGDTFNAALAVALAEGAPMPHALRFASAAAAISVTRAGAQASAPSRGEVDAFLVAR